jgi:hypothetical protein
MGGILGPVVAGMMTAAGAVAGAARQLTCPLQQLPMVVSGKSLGEEAGGRSSLGKRGGGSPQGWLVLGVFSGRQTLQDNPATWVGCVHQELAL